MKLLIDTNVLIGIEDNGPVRAQFANLVRGANRHGLSIFVHEASKEDVMRDKDAERRKATLSRIRKFQPLTGVPTPADAKLVAQYGKCSKPNDFVDAKLLHALTVNAVDFLISDDIGLHKRAKAVGIDARVFAVEDSVAWIRRMFEPRPVFLPQVDDILAYQLDFSDPIFDGLRADYRPNFDGWCKKISNEHRPCWVVRDGKRLAALVIRKDETHQRAQTINPGPKILKISTFKVASDYRGQKLGEQLLKQFLWYAQLNNYDLVYLTAYPKQKTLLMLLDAYGFVQTKITADGQLFLEKPIERGPLAVGKGETALAAAMRSYPRFVANGSVGKYVVPIRPNYHAELFPEFQQAGGSTGAATGRPGNTIEKVYLCRSKTRTMRSGDVILFYMSRHQGVRGSQCVTSVGVVKTVRSSADLDEVKRWTAKRSVYSDEDLEAMIDEADTPLMIIDFLLIGHLSAAVTLDALTNACVLTSWPQSIVRLDEAQFVTLKAMMDLGFEF